jgi:type II secretory pathway component GspD/PulD (secretin)
MNKKTALMLVFALVLWRGVVLSQEPVSGSAPTTPAPSANALAAETPAVMPDKPTNGVALNPNPATTTEEKAPENAAASSAATDEQVEITMEPDVKLPDAIQLLARLAKINYQFDPALLADKLPDGTPAPVPVVGVEIRWKGVTAAQALEALLENNNWQIVSNSSTGIQRIMRKDGKVREPMITRVIHLKYSNPTNILTQLTNAFKLAYPETVIAPDTRTSQLVVVATEQALSIIESTIESLDKPTKQILIEARMIETTRNPETLKGVDWSGTLAKQNVTFGNGNVSTAEYSKGSTTTTPGTTTTTGTGKTVTAASSTTSTATSTVTSTLAAASGATGMPGLTANTLSGFSPSTAFLNADGVSAALSFLNTDTETEQVALPRTVAQDGVQTELVVVRNVPVFEQNQTPSQNGSTPMTTVKPVYDEKVGDVVINEVGVKLIVTPRVVGHTNVSLELRPEISNQEADAAEFKLNGMENQSPIFTRRRVSTRATVPSGYTLVLGGLNNDVSTKKYTKVPLLGDIPGLGLMFRKEDKSRTKQNLMIFVTPTIIQDSDFQHTPSEFLKTRFVDKPDVEESAWDSGKPKDWTKPKGEVEPVYSPVAH